MPSQANVRMQLTKRLDALTADIARLEAVAGRPLDDDFAEQAIQREDDDATNALERSALAEVAATERAIARLDSGNYGVCTQCGHAIAPERLKALPAAATCIDCARVRRNASR